MKKKKLRQYPNGGNIYLDEILSPKERKLRKEQKKFSENSKYSSPNRDTFEDMRQAEENLRRWELQDANREFQKFGSSEDYYRQFPSEKEYDLFYEKWDRNAIGTSKYLQRDEILMANGGRFTNPQTYSNPIETASVYNQLPLRPNQMSPSFNMRQNNQAFANSRPATGQANITMSPVEMALFPPSAELESLGAVGNTLLKTFNPLQGVRGTGTGALTHIAEHEGAHYLKDKALGTTQPINTKQGIGEFKNGGTMDKIKIKPSKKGTFTKAAKEHGKGVQEFASQVLANKESYSPAMVKKANFARNASKWNKAENGLFNMEDPEFRFGDEGYTQTPQNQTFQQTGEMLGTGFQFGSNGDDMYAPNVDPNKFTFGQGNPQKPPKFNFGFNTFGGNKYFEKANVFGNAALAGLNIGKGLLNVAGDNIQNQKVKDWESQQLRQSLYSGMDNQPPDFNKYGKGMGENFAYQEHGGMMKYKPYNQGGMANVEVEDNEIIQTPEGLIEGVNGATHDQGGIKLNLPQGSKIFSDKLKDPITKKPYSKLAKKFETKKEFDRLEKQPEFLDDINLKTTEMMIGMKNKLSDELFAKQEEDKISGKHGTSVKNQTMKDYGFTKYAKGGKVDNNPPLAGTKGIGQDLFGGDLETVYNYAKALGYKGQKDIGSLQSWAKTKDPRAISDYMQTVKPNKKAEKIWRERYSKTEPVDMMKMTPDERVEAFNDNLWDFRFPKLSQGEKPTFKMPVKQPLIGDPVGKTEISPVTNQPIGRDFGNLNFNFQIPDTYPKDPIWTKQLSPSYITPEKIVPYYNDIIRGNRAITQNVGSRTGADVANLIQSQTLANEQIGKRIYDADVYNTQTANQMKPFNANAKMQTDRVNLGEFNTFLDRIASREGVIQGQKKFDDNAAIQRMFDSNAYDERVDYISNTFNPSRYSTETAFNFDPITGEPLKKKTHGGKIKLNLKKKKK